MTIISGDRHLRPDPTGRLRTDAKNIGAIASVIVSPDYARSPAGQHLVHMLMSLLARQFGILQRITVEVPPVPILGLRDPGSEDLREAVIQIGREAAGPEIAITNDNRKSAPTVAVLVGPGLDPQAFGCPAVAVAADGWRLAVSTSHSLSVLGCSPNPTGPYLAACVAAGFVFKAALGYLDDIELALSLWDFVTGTWTALPAGDEPAGVLLPDSYVLGAGAVGAAATLTLGVMGMSGRLIVVDPQDQSTTDRNRLITGTYGTVGTPKVELVCRGLAGTGISCFPVQARWPDQYLAMTTCAIPDDIRQREREYRFPWVLSCVDRNRDRRNIAKYLPRHIIGGSTHGLVAQVAYYTMEGPCECLACNHPPLPAATVEELREQLLALDSAGREEWLVRHGADERTRAAIAEYLNEPGCGGLGAAELARLGREGEVDWAAGFVSVAAGVLQASVFAQAAQRGLDEVVVPRSELRYLFWPNELLCSAAQRHSGCDVCGDPSTRAQWRELWS